MAGVIRELLPFAVALYLFDALAWVTAREVVVTSLTGTSFRIRRCGLNLLGLLPTTLDLRVCANRPLVTPHTVILPPTGPVTPAALTDPAGCQFVDLSEAAKSVVDHTSISFGGGKTWKASSTAAARSFHSFLVELSRLPAESREARISEYYENAFDHEAVANRLEEFLGAVGPVQPLGDSLFFMVFLMLPGCVIFAPSDPVLVSGVSLITGVLWAVTAAMTFRLARRLADQGGLRPDMTRLATVLLPPPTAFRGVHVLAAGLFHDMEPVAVVAGLLPADQLKPVLRAEIAAVSRAIEAGGTDDWQHAWSQRGKVLSRLLDCVDLSERDLEVTAGAEVGGICPACSASYRPGFGRCSDCAVALIPTVHSTVPDSR